MKFQGLLLIKKILFNTKFYKLDCLNQLNKMNILKTFTLLTVLTLTACTQQNKTTTDSTLESVGFTGSPDNSWVLGSQENLDTWIKWCDLHTKKDINGILNLAWDSIRVKGPNNQSIEGKENFKSFITEWFKNYDVTVNQEWGIPINFMDKDGKKDDGDWIINGHKLKTRKDAEMTIEDNHANVYIKDGKVRFFKIYNHSTTTSKMVSTKFSVDMSNYNEKYENVCLNGTFNNWCGSCNTMSDDDNDGVYEITVEVPSGEIEYKFTIDGWNLEETFEKGMPCSKTTGEFTNRVASVHGDTSLSKVCFNACSTCE